MLFSTMLRTSSKVLSSPATASRAGLGPIRILGLKTRAHAQEKQDAPAETTSGELTRRPAEQAPGQVAPRSAVDLVGFPAPFRRLSDYVTEMQREMDAMAHAFGMPTDPFDMFERALGPVSSGGLFPDLSSPAQLALASPATMMRSLAVDVEEDDRQYTVHAEVPGFEKEEIKVLLSPEGMLNITAEKRVETTAAAAGDAAAQAKEGGGAKDKEQQLTTTTPQQYGRRYASMRRSLLLPSDVDPEAIKATCKNGVLTVTIPKVPKPAAPKPKEIPIA